MDEVIQADVPLEPMGMANGVKNMGGLLEQSLRSLAIECLPRDLPDLITVDVSALNIGDAIHVREIPVAHRRDDQSPTRSHRILGPRADGGGRAGGRCGGSADWPRSDPREEGRTGSGGGVREQRTKRRSNPFWIHSTSLRFAQERFLVRLRRIGFRIERMWTKKLHRFA